MRLLAIAVKSLKETYRDPLALGFLLGFPLMFMVLFGAIFSGDTTSRYDVGVVDEDNTPWSQSFTSEALSQVSMFEISTYDDTATALSDLTFGDLKAYIVIPQGFGKQVEKNWQGDKADITLNITYDESDLMVSEQIISILGVATRSFAQIEALVTINAEPIHVEEEITYLDFIGPGIIVFGILIMIPTAARIMVRDKEKGMLSRLVTTPARPIDFILGYSLCLVLIAIAQIVIIMVATKLFGLNMTGSPFLAFLIFLLTSLCCIGIGMTVASVTKTENQAEPLCWLFAMPLASLSGCWFSMELMPSYLKNVAYAFPFAHTIDATRAILIRGVGLESEAVRGNFLFLIGWAVAIFALGIILFRRSMRS
jgi:ABC-2 type transport system permease protein